MNFVYQSQRVTMTEEEQVLSSDTMKLWGWFVKHEEPWDALKPITDEDRILLHWPAVCCYSRKLFMLQYSASENTTLLIAPGGYKFESTPAHCDFWDRMLTKEGLLRVPIPQVQMPILDLVLNYPSRKNHRFLGLSTFC
jgi:hypothetical protein